MGAASLHLFRAVPTAPAAGIVVWAALVVALLLALVAILDASFASGLSNDDGLFAPFRWLPGDDRMTA
ncbi:MAG: hypothetical protein ABIP53_10310 [Candidatus Limnocylindrales bacterium]